MPFNKRKLGKPDLSSCPGERPQRTETGISCTSKLSEVRCNSRYLLKIVVVSSFAPFDLKMRRPSSKYT